MPVTPPLSSRRLVSFGLVLVSFACSRQSQEPGDAAPSASVARVVPSARASVDVTSAASPAWDAGPPLLVKGAVDGAELRRKNLARIAADKSPVTLLQGKSPRELGERICKAVVPKRPASTPVLLKPNMGGFEWFKDPTKSDGDDGVRGRTTDPEFVRGVVRCLKARGHERITIAEGWGARHADWLRLIEVSGYQAMAREEGVALVAMDDDGVFDVEGDTPGKPLKVRGMGSTLVPTLLMPKVLAEHLEKGLFISIPKLKTHRFSVVSISIKGMQGTTMLSDAAPAYRQKWRNHKELKEALTTLKTDRAAGSKQYLTALQVFARRMTDILEIEAPHAVLVDGAPAVGGDGFSRFWPSKELVAIGGTNPILVDRVGSEFLGLWDNAKLGQQLGGPRSSPLITSAAKRFGVDVEAPKVVGDGAALLKSARPVHFLSMSGFRLLSDDEPALRTLPPVAGATPKPAAPPAALASKDAPRVDAPQLAVHVDGKREAAWDKATPAVFDSDWSGKASGIKSEVRFAWSKQALFALFELHDTGLFVDRTRPLKTEREGLYREDCVELFLTPKPSQPQRYFEIELGPYGHFFDLIVDRNKQSSDAGWSSGASVATQVDAKERRATIEVALRAPEITSVLSTGAELPLGIYRMEGKSPRRYLAWSPTRTPKPNFHVPEAFGRLVLK